MPLLLLSLLYGCEIIKIVDHNLDDDNDGFDDVNFGGDDCDDGDQYIHPDADEIRFDQVDQNCSGMDDEDQDGDGLTILEGDCDDFDPAIFQGGIEFVDDVDNNCNGDIDELNYLHGSFLSYLGAFEGDLSGTSFFGGDMDGDGNDDLAIGAPEARGIEDRAGKAHLIDQIDRSDSREVSLADSDDAVLGVHENDRFASSVVLGDFDTDDQVDLVVGIKGSDAGGTGSGAVEFYSGETISSETLEPTYLWTGPGDNAVAGGVLSLGGDINRDSSPDLLIGAHGFDGSRGAVFALMGSAQGWTDGNLLDVASVIYMGQQQDEQFGWSLSGGFDVNNDGYDDVLVGAPGNRANGLGSGAAYLFLGGDAPSIIPTVIFHGESPFDQAGYSVALLKDINGDDFDDVLITAPWHDGIKQNIGAAYIIFGRENFTDMTLSEADLIIGGTLLAEQLGFDSASLMDVNGDGFGDFGLGSLSDFNGEDAGAVCLFLGGEFLQPALDSSKCNAEFIGNEGDHAYVINTVGNVNASIPGYEQPFPFFDFAIGAPDSDEKRGRTFLVFGQQTD